MPRRRRDRQRQQKKSPGEQSPPMAPPPRQQRSPFHRCLPYPGQMLPCYPQLPPAPAPAISRGPSTVGIRPAAASHYVETTPPRPPAPARTCRWGHCREVFTDEDSFMAHVNRHVNTNTKHCCFWSGCIRYGVEYKRRSFFVKHMEREHGIIVETQSEAQRDRPHRASMHQGQPPHPGTVPFYPPPYPHPYLHPHPYPYPQYSFPGPSTISRGPVFVPQVMHQGQPPHPGPVPFCQQPLSSSHYPPYPRPLAPARRGLVQPQSGAQGVRPQFAPVIPPAAPVLSLPETKDEYIYRIRSFLINDWSMPQVVVDSIAIKWRQDPQISFNCLCYLSHLLISRGPYSIIARISQGDRNKAVELFRYLVYCHNHNHIDSAPAPVPPTHPPPPPPPRQPPASRVSTPPQSSTLSHARDTQHHRTPRDPVERGIPPPPDATERLPNLFNVDDFYDPSEA